ncbi:MAG: bifunctional aspartate kinase/homoserine dehydrogenase I [Flavisolibacter sp.]
MQVLKFGGSSVANEKNIKQVASIVRQAVAQDKTVVVVSALGGITDLLLQAGILAATNDSTYKQTLEEIKQRHVETVKLLLPITHQSSILSTVLQHCNELEDVCNGVYLLNELSNRIKDRIASYGEIMSSQILSAYLKASGLQNTWTDARELITTDSNYTRASVQFDATYQRIQQYFQNTSDVLFIVPGFIAANEQVHTTTLGRGGSDYTAALFGAATNASLVQIWTDVPGMMTADPRLVPHAKTIEAISFQEAMELSHFGAKVIYPPTIQPLLNKNLSVWVKSTFLPEHHGTLIQSATGANGNMIRGISSINKVALISLEGSGMVGIPGFSKRLFESLARQSINVIFITQASSEHTICVGIEEANIHLAKTAVDEEFKNEIKEGKVDPLEIETGLAIVALVGENMKNHTGVSGKMFSALGRNGINIRAIAQGSSERNISVVINAPDVKKAINVLHEDFFEEVYKQVNLFIVGTGNVGKKLLNQLEQQLPYLQKQLGLQLRIIGLANSRKMAFDEKGIRLNNWQEAMDNGDAMNLESFIGKVQSKNLRNSVFVDVTANADVAKTYAPLFGKSISVVACNKIAPSSSFENYQQLKKLAREFSALFLFETNVGAGLPIINTLSDLISSGDEVNKIEAVLSGTLNFVFNHYNGERSFASVVRQAQEEGYTEPDPRLDLSGTDVMRKILILAREAGYELEMDDISNKGFLPPSCMEGSVEDFYAEMEKHEEHFKKIYSAAAAEGKKLKYVASFNNGKASVGLQHIDPAHDLYHLYGKDNVVLFYTNRYVEQPLVVKGAGAGAEVTASGVFADIVRAARI